MKLLAIETSSDRASLAVSNDALLFSSEQLGVTAHAPALLPLIESLLLQANLKISELDGIIFGSGPGSFTGLRIACAVAKAMAWAHEIPLYPFSALDNIALQAANKASDLPNKDLLSGILVMIDARMQQFYWAFYGMDAKILISAQVQSSSEIVFPMGQDIFLAGLGFESYLAKSSALIGETLVERWSFYPDAVWMIEAFKKNLCTAVAPIDAGPCYIRSEVVG